MLDVVEHKERLDHVCVADLVVALREQHAEEVLPRLFSDRCRVIDGCSEVAEEQ